MKLGGTFRTQFLNPKKALLNDCIGGLVFTIILVLITLIGGFGTVKAYTVLTIAIAAFSLGLFLSYTGRYNSAVLLYYIVSIIVISGISYFLPEIKYEGLLFIPTGITAFLYLDRRNNSFYIFLFFALLAIVTFAYQFYLEAPVITNQNDVVYNHFILFFFIAYTSLKIVFLIETTRFAIIEMDDTDKEYESLFENSYDAILVYNYKKHRYINCNEKACKLFGFTREELLSYKGVFNLFPDTQKDGKKSEDHIKGHLEHFEKTKKSIRFEFLRKKMNGEIFETETTLVSAARADEIMVIIKDISEKKKAEQEIKASEERFRTIIETSPNGITLINMEGEMTFISKRSLEIFGTSLEDRLGKSILDTIHPDDHFKIKEGIGALMAGLEPPYTRFRGLYPNGSTIHIEATARFLESPSDNKKEILIVFNDITKRILAEEALKKQNAIYQALIDNSFDGIDIIQILDWDVKEGALKGRLIARNKPMEKMLRSTDGLMLNKNDILSISPEKLPGGIPSDVAIDKYMTRIIEEGRYRYDWQVIDEEGKLIDLDMVSQYIVQNNQVIFIRIAEDVTEKKKAEKRLKESQQRYQNFLDTSPDGIVVTDMRGTVTYASPHIKHLYGYESNDDFYGCNTLDFVAEENKEYTLQEIGKILDKGEIRNLLSKVIHRDGSIFYLESNIKLLYDEEGKPKEMLFVQRDVTEKIKQQEMLSQTMENLNEKNVELKKYIDSNMELENFAYIASHDLQAPIRSIISFTQLLGRSMASKLETKEQEYLDFVVTASRNMKSLIDDLLSYSRVNTNAANFTETDVKTLITHIKLELQAEIEAKGAQINLCADPPETIIADKVKLKQLLQNLISNGLKFAKHDTPPIITIDFKEKKRDWYFSVKDNGIGIKEEFQEKIFLIFQRLHTNQEYEGTGIGLAICKKIAEQHGGKLGVKSEYGAGSQFYFTISKKLQPSVHAEKV